MDTLKTHKGYNKLSHIHNLENQPFHTNTNTTRLKKPLIITILTATILIFSLLLGCLVGMLIYRPHRHNSPLSPPNSTIHLVCNVTQHPAPCIHTLSALNTRPDPDPNTLFTLSLIAALSELNHTHSTLSPPNRVGSGSRARAGLGDCDELLNDAYDNVNQTVTAVEGRGDDAATWVGDEKVKGDLNTWLSAALTDLDTCVDGLEEVGSTVVDGVKGKVQGAKVCLSNSLAILVNINKLVEMFHRDGSAGHD